MRTSAIAGKLPFVILNLLSLTPHAVSTSISLLYANQSSLITLCPADSPIVFEPITPIIPYNIKRVSSNLLVPIKVTEKQLVVSVTITGLHHDIDMVIRQVGGEVGQHERLCSILIPCIILP